MVGGDYRRNYVLVCGQRLRVTRSLQPGDEISGGFFCDSVVDTFYIFFNDRTERLRRNFCEFCHLITIGVDDDNLIPEPPLLRGRW